jgi:hypothetical protein
LVGIIDRAYNRRSWHGTNLRGSIRGLTARDVVWRPAPGRHNIWELVVHAAYWKYAVLRMLTGAPRGSFPLKGSNWFERSGPSNQRNWKKDVVLLDRTHRALRDTIEGLSPQALNRRNPGSQYTTFELVAGIAAHDLYHAGQIQLIKRLRRSR